MTILVKELHERIACTAINRRGYRLYSEELRRDLRDYTLMRVEKGASFKEIAAALGVAAGTLQNWCKDQSRPSKGSIQPMGFRPVEVLGDHGPAKRLPSEACARPAVAGPSLSMSNGIRIEGLSVAELAVLLKELGCC